MQRHPSLLAAAPGVDLSVRHARNKRLQVLVRPLGAHGCGAREDFRASGLGMRCAVCRIDDDRVRRHETHGGRDIGSAHHGECFGLLYEAFFATITNAAEWEHALVLWRWRRRAADVAGEPFREAPPDSPAEHAATKAIYERGLEGVMAEIQADIQRRSITT